MPTAVRAAAVQLEPAIGDVAENLRRCEELGDEAGAAGATWIVLPEFFTTGMAFDPRLADAALPEDGAALTLLRHLAVRHGATVGGSFLCRDPDGHNRNAFLLVGPDGHVLGRHDKDLPTMWEACFYVDGHDDGVIPLGGQAPNTSSTSQGRAPSENPTPGGQAPNMNSTIARRSGEPLAAGAAVCWELMRTQTVRRLRGRIDVLVGGSAWWSIPPWPPAAITRRMEARNARTAAHVAQAMAPLVGAPVVHAAHCGPIACAMPWSPLRYMGHFQGGALVCDAAGTVLARRDHREGPGLAIADVELGRVAPRGEVPDRFWLHPRGALPAATWAYQRAHGARWYARHAHGRPTADALDPRLAPPPARREPAVA